MIIERIKPNFYYNANVDYRFCPGINLIPPNKINAVKNDFDCQDLIKNKIHILVEDVEKNKDESNPQQKTDILKKIKNMRVEQVIKIIKKTVIIGTLKKIESNDLRMGVQNAIKAQLENIKPKEGE